MDENLIYGKNKTDRIVSIECHDNSLKIFRRLEDGSLEESFIPNKYWLLAHRQINKSWIKLNGELHYKWGKQFETLKEMKTAKYFLGKSEEDVYGISDGKEQSMVNKGITYYKGMTPKDLSVLSFDIETTGLDPNHPDAKVLLISNTFRHNGKIDKRLFAYNDYHMDDFMIEDWCKWVREMNPDCLIGHNIFSFDLPYLNTRIKAYEPKTLDLGRDNSPMKINKYPSDKRVDGSRDLSYHKCIVYGREIVDTMFVAMDYDIAKKYETFGLKKIISQEGLEKKDRIFYDASKIRFNYKDPEEFKKIKAYCIDDSDDALALFDLMIPAKFYLAHSIPKSFQEMICSASGSQLNSFLVRSYLQNAHSIPKTSQLEYVKGGISFGIPGIYSNVIKIDLKSAYPSQVLRFKLFDPEKDPNGNFYKMVHHFTYERFELKDKYKATGDKYYSDREQASKVVINSAYGLMATPGLNFNCGWIAQKITHETRQMINKALEWSSGKDMEFYKQYMKENEHELV